MKKKYVTKDEAVTSTPTPWCGFVSTDRTRGGLFYAGQSIDDDKTSELVALGFRVCGTVPNISFGAYPDNAYSSIDEFLEDGLRADNIAVEIYFFDNQREWLAWLSDGE